MIEALQKILEHWVELVILIGAFLIFVKSEKYYH